nr:hypothetical protein [uncultured Desulfobulbus sp.]
MAHILIVDDEPMVYEMPHAHYAPADHSVKTAQSLRDEYHLSPPTSIAPLFSDLHPPDGNRREALQRVAHTFSCPKILLLTGSAVSSSSSSPGRPSFPPRQTTSLDNSPLGVNGYLRNSRRYEIGDNIQYHG